MRSVSFLQHQLYINLKKRAFRPLYFSGLLSSKGTRVDEEVRTIRD